MNINFAITVGTVTDDSGTALTTQAFSGNDTRKPENPHNYHGHNNSGTVKLVDGSEVPAQSLHKIGPMPCAVYRVGEFGHHNDLGDVVAELTQISSDENWGRNDFFIHGPGKDYDNSSEGCLVIPHDARLKIAGLRPTTLTVQP
jgi:hypothetical protein